MRRFIIFLLFYFVQSISCQSDIYICASCKSTDITKFKNVVQCECSQSDTIISNRIVCMKNNEAKNCKGFTGQCCNNNNETCPLCSKNDFTRNFDCSCESLDLEMKTLYLPVTKFLDKVHKAPAYCCDDTSPETVKITPPPGRKKIIPNTKYHWKKRNYIADSDD